MQRAVWPHSAPPTGEEASDSCCSPRQVAARRRTSPLCCCYHLSFLPLLTPLNQTNTRQAALLWKEFPKSKACAARTVGNVCSNNRKLVMFPLLLERGCSRFQVCCLCRYLRMWIAFQCIASMSFNTSAKPFPNRGKSVRGNTAGTWTQCAKVLPCASDAHRTAVWQLLLFTVSQSLFEFTMIVRRLHCAEVKWNFATGMVQLWWHM